MIKINQLFPIPIRKQVATDKKPSDFNIGEVYKMAVASRSHVKKPYYVIIKNKNKHSIQTNIPHRHSLIIKYISPEWDYHIPRMTFVGNDDKSRKLVTDPANGVI